jgi:hypothetical protein
MRLRPIASPAAWRADRVHPSEFVFELSRGQIRELDATARDLMERGTRLRDITRDDFALPRTEPLLRDVLNDVTKGRGFALIRGLDPSGYPDALAEILFWGLGQHLGIPEPQDASGVLIHRVKDIGASVRGNDHVRGYQTNARLDAHNDGGDMVTLFCLRQAPYGGDSFLVSAASLFNAIVRWRPDVAWTLQQPFYFDARAQQRPGQPPYQQVPIFSFVDERVHVLYKRGYIHLAQRFDDVPTLSLKQMEALDYLDELCLDPRYRLEFRLRPGDIQIANNLNMLHGRTAFRNGARESTRRELLRLWLTHREGEPLPRPFANTREFGVTFERRLSLAAD